MKFERLLLGLFASFLMVGCSQNEDLPNGGEEGKGKDSYISVKVVSKSTASRAATAGAFEYGKDYENQVNNAHFFFFDKDGNPYGLTAGDGQYDVNGSTTKLNGTAKDNWIYFSSFVDTQGNSETDNVTSTEKVLEAVLVFQGKQSTPPAKVVAVLNMDNTSLADQTSGISLENLAKKMIENDKAYEIVKEGDETTGNFVISNSVYATGDNNEVIVNATDITNMTKSTAEAALGDPVNIYVERLAVKVSVEIASTLVEGNALLEGANNILKVPEVTLGEDKKPVYVQILGWELNSTINKSFLLKDISSANSTWEYATSSWNDSDNKRSYWLSSVPTSTGVQYTTSFSWHGLNNQLKASDYCFENVGATTSKVVVKAQLVDENKKAITVAQWLGSYYLASEGENNKTNWDGLLSNVATTLNLWKPDGTSYKQIEGSDLKIEPMYGTSDDPSNDAHDFYKVKFVLNNTNETWYKKDADGKIASTSVNQEYITETLGGVVPAKVWQDGATYYFTELEHFNGKKAIVRNHYYKVSITGVKGLGTPVYYPDGYTPETPNPEIPEIPDPVVPSDDETYLSAKINVLSWKLVNNNVVLGQ